MIYFGHVKTISGRGSINLSGDVRLYWGWSIFFGDGKSFLGKIKRDKRSFPGGYEKSIWG
jgi:hypothetical protein